ncbi:MAG: hypothetical protein MI742_02595 [Desulfobacterales bacterium]|nr:hypothetical protein [Desulfobacterales bacterium]
MTTVFIWNNHKMSIGGHTWFGHASMNITDIWAKAYGDKNMDNYISWVPEDEKLSHSGHQQGFAQANIFTDLVYEGYAPDHIIRLPATPMQVEKMLAQWHKAKEKNARYKEVNVKYKGLVRSMEHNYGPSYRYFAKNCSTMVIRVLKSAQMKRKHFMKEALSIVWTPLTVKRYAQNIHGAKNILWNDFVDELVSCGSISRDFSMLLKKFQRRHESSGASGAPARNLKSGKQSAYANKNSLNKMSAANYHQYKGHRKTLVEFIESIGAI